MTSEPLSSPKVLLLQKTLKKSKHGKWKKKNSGGKLSLARIVLPLGSLLSSLYSLRFFLPTGNWKHNVLASWQDENFDLLQRYTLPLPVCPRRSLTSALFPSSVFWRSQYSLRIPKPKSATSHALVWLPELLVLAPLRFQTLGLEMIT